MSSLILGVETSGLSGSVSLRRDGQTVETMTLETSGRRHAQTLMSEVDAMLRRQGESARRVELVAVGIGPGSFTGLRVGVVFAKTLAYAVGCRLVAVDSFHAVAASSPANVAHVSVVGDAQRGDLFVGHFRRTSSSRPDEWIRQGNIVIQRTDDWIADLTTRAREESGIVVSGPATDAVRARLPTSVSCLNSEFHWPRADVVAELGEQSARRGDFADLWTLEPFYLRRSAAEEKAMKPASESA